MKTITKTKVEQNNAVITPEIKEEIGADVQSRKDVEGVKMNEKDIADMLNWMRTRINAKSAKKQKNFEPIKEQLVKDILEYVKPGEYYFRNKDLGYLTQYAENAVANNEKFYKTVQAVFRMAK